MENMYKVNIIDASRELSKREKLMFTDFAKSISLNDESKGGEKLIITPAAWAMVHVINPLAKSDKATGEKRDEYDVFVVQDENGALYSTSSKPFVESFMRIWSVMKDDAEPEDFDIEVYRVASQNNSGDFLTCTIV